MVHCGTLVRNGERPRKLHREACMASTRRVSLRLTGLVSAPMSDAVAGA